MRHSDRIKVRARRTVGVLTAVLAGFALSGCDAMDKLLEIETPNSIPASKLDGPESATLLLSGAIGDFENALSTHILQQSQLAGELHDGTSSATRWMVPSRTVMYFDANYPGLSYTPLSKARWTADNALKLLQGWTDAQVTDRQTKIATAAVYAGFSLVILGESYCTMAIDLSAALQPAAVYQMAEQRFTTAITAAQAAGSGATKWLNAAYVGRARARLDQGNTAGAASDAALVPVGFRLDATYSAANSRRYNNVYEETRTGSISVTEPYWNLTVDGKADPRVPVLDMKRKASDGLTALMNQQLYLDRASPIPMARWEETQLILAEVQGGAQAVNIINNLRTRRGLAGTYAGGTAAEIKAQVGAERQRELFLDGHRIGDLQRYNLPFFPAVGVVYPKGGIYGDVKCFPIPAVEINANPNLR
ncbi:MAG: RagB/SusD family nutrient uptake outer membrane protein [Gemmatimonadetes bacterium]|nr:RagB/SusD family nutrient uptake outer membrane protein [Gemmatimonadota bacterium]